MEWEPGVVGWGKRGGKRGGSGRGKGRVGDAFSIAENAKNCIPPAFICVTLQQTRHYKCVNRGSSPGSEFASEARECCLFPLSAADLQQAMREYCDKPVPASERLC